MKLQKKLMIKRESAVCNLSNKDVQATCQIAWLHTKRNAVSRTRRLQKERDLRLRLSVTTLPAFLTSSRPLGLSCDRSKEWRRAPLRSLWLEPSHIGCPVGLRTPIDVRDIFSRRPRGLIDVVDGTGRVIAPTADEIAKRRVTGEAVLWLVTFT